MCPRLEYFVYYIQLMPHISQRTLNNRLANKLQSPLRFLLHQCLPSKQKLDKTQRDCKMDFLYVLPTNSLFFFPWQPRYISQVSAPFKICILPFQTKPWYLQNGVSILWNTGDWVEIETLLSRATSPCDKSWNNTLKSKWLAVLWEGTKIPGSVLNYELWSGYLINNIAIHQRLPSYFTLLY